MTTSQPFKFFADTATVQLTPEQRKAGFVEDTVRAMACAGAAIGYLEQLAEHREGRYAAQAVASLLERLRKDLEHTQDMEPATFVAWLEDAEDTLG